jgi:hypothetical protein
MRACVPRADSVLVLETLCRCQACPSSLFERARASTFLPGRRRRSQSPRGSGPRQAKALYRYWPDVEGRLLAVRDERATGFAPLRGLGRLPAVSRRPAADMAGVPATVWDLALARKGRDSNPRDGFPRPTVFKTAAFNRSATLPWLKEPRAPASRHALRPG